MKLLTASLAACLLLSSCVFHSNIGKRIREPGEVCTGVALPASGGKVYKATFQTQLATWKYKEVGGKYHRVETTETRRFTRYYTHVPEVAFRRCSDLFRVNALLDSYPRPQLYDIHPTGKSRLAEVVLDEKGQPDGISEVVEALPAHAVVSHTCKKESGELQLREWADYPHTKASWGRRIAAAPFDYLIDPALKTVFYTGEAAYFLALAPFAGVYYLVDSALGEDAPTLKPDSTEP